MAEVDAQAYAVTSLNAAAGASNSVETQQPGASGALRQVVVQGDATTRANMQTVKAASTAAVATDMASVVALHPTSPLPTGSNTIGALTANQSINNAQINGTAPLMGNGVTGTGSQRVTIASDNTTFNTTPSASTAAGSTTSYFNSAQLATVTAMKASAGKVYGLNVYNPNTTIAYLQMFDLATGSVTLGTTTPKKSFPIPATGYLDLSYTVPMGFATAISHAATTTVTGLTAPTTGLVINGEYI